MNERWQVDEGAILTSEGKCVVELPALEGDKPQPLTKETVAMLRLISAAPELYTLLSRARYELATVAASLDASFRAKTAREFNEKILALIHYVKGDE